MHTTKVMEELARRGLIHLEASILWYLRGGELPLEELGPSRKTITFRHEQSAFAGEEEFYVEDLKLRDWVRIDRIMARIGQPQIDSSLKRLEDLELINRKPVDAPKHYMAARKYKLTDWGKCLVDSQTERIRKARDSEKIELDTEKLTSEPCYPPKDELCLNWSTILQEKSS